MLMQASQPTHEDIAFELPEPLRRFGATTTVSAVGKADAPVIVALGGISGNRFVCRGADGGRGWWPGLVGAGCAVDPHRYRVVGLDFAADETGAAAPSTADQAAVVAAALDAIGVERARAIVGASYGGMVALKFAEHLPHRVDRLVVISAGAEPHPTATAARELQRRVVALGLATGSGVEALAIARGMAMLTYRTPDEFAERFDGGLADERPLGPTAPGAYLAARGAAFQSVMTPERFLSLSASIDRHAVDPGKVRTPALLIGASSDQLVPPIQMQRLAERLAGPTKIHLLDCLYGHDMFLKEAARVGALAASFLESQ